MNKQNRKFIFSSTTKIVYIYTKSGNDDTTRKGLTWLKLTEQFSQWMIFVLNTQSKKKVLHYVTHVHSFDLWFEKTERKNKTSLRIELYTVWMFHINIEVVSIFSIFHPEDTNSMCVVFAKLREKKGNHRNEDMRK